MEWCNFQWPRVNPNYSIFDILYAFYIFVVETRHFKCPLLIDTEVYYCMRDRLPPKGMCSGSNDLLNFGK